MRLFPLSFIDLQSYRCLNEGVVGHLLDIRR